MKSSELLNDLAAVFRWTAKLNMHEAIANHFSVCKPGSNEDFYASINNVSDVLYLNGTTDYVEVFMKSLSEDSSGTMIAYGNISGGFGVGMNSFFSGTLISRTS